MSISDRALQDFIREHPALIVVRLTDWRGMTEQQRATIRAGLDSRQIQVVRPARWTLAGPVVGDDSPDADDVLLVAHDRRVEHRTVLWINAVAALHGRWPSGNRSDAIDAARSRVEVELDAREATSS